MIKKIPDSNVHSNHNYLRLLSKNGKYAETVSYDMGIKKKVVINSISRGQILKLKFKLSKNYSARFKCIYLLCIYYFLITTIMISALNTFYGIYASLNIVIY